LTQIIQNVIIYFHGGGILDKALTFLLEQRALQEYSLEEALKYVKENVLFRDTGGELKKIIDSKGADLKELKTRFGKMNFSNWLKGKNISREKAIELCFALNLDIFETEDFLQKCGHDWFHFRNYMDIIYYFSLSNKLPYESATRLIVKYNYLNSANPTPAQCEEKHSQTFMFKQEVEDFLTENELHSFLTDNKDMFGYFNNTAYRHFKCLFDKVLSNEIEYHTSEKKRNKDNSEVKKHDRGNISFAKICEMMRIGIPKNLRKGELTHLQHCLYEGAPSRPTILDMYNKKVGKNGKIKQITRKPLIILWMMTNEEKAFIPRVKLINGILEECVMPKLDSKNPFDWIVLNALESDGIVRMEEIIRNIFGSSADHTFDRPKPSRSAILYVLEKGSKTAKIPINSDKFVLGRNRSEVDCCFDSKSDRNISRKHAQISKHDGKYILTHISATQGVYTYVNSKKRLGHSETVSLSCGDIIQIGERELLFKLTE